MEGDIKMRQILKWIAGGVVATLCLATTIPVSGDDGAFFRVDKVMKSKVLIQEDQAAGQVVDFVVSREGCIDYLVASHEEQFYAIPFSAAVWRPATSVFFVDITPVQFREVHFFARNDWPDFASTQFRERSFSTFGVSATRTTRTHTDIDVDRRDVDVDRSSRRDVDVDRSRRDVDVERSTRRDVDVDRDRRDVDVDRSTRRERDVDVDRSRRDVDVDRDRRRDVDADRNRRDVDIDRSSRRERDVDVDRSRRDVDVERKSQRDVDVDRNRRDTDVDRSSRRDTERGRTDPPGTGAKAPGRSTKDSGSGKTTPRTGAPAGGQTVPKTAPGAKSGGKSTPPGSSTQKPVEKQPKSDEKTSASRPY
jgi:hypothetical protein